MAIQVTGFFPNPNNDSYVKDAVITLNVKQVPMGRLDVECNLKVEKEVTTPSTNVVTTQLVSVSQFTVNNIDRSLLTFNDDITDPYEKLLDGVQTYLISKFEEENPDVTLGVYEA